MREPPDEFDEYVAEVARLMNVSYFVIVLAPPNAQASADFAVEIGCSVLLDKPIILLVRPGTVLPNKLVALADDIIEMVDYDAALLTGQLQDAIDRLVSSGRV